MIENKNPSFSQCVKKNVLNVMTISTLVAHDHVPYLFLEATIMGHSLIFSLHSKKITIVFINFCIILLKKIRCVNCNIICLQCNFGYIWIIFPLMTFPCLKIVSLHRNLIIYLLMLRM